MTAPYTAQKTPENPQVLEKKISFQSLKELRDELTKQAKNKDRLEHFQKTIDTAINEDDKKGIIEFTEREWTELISDNNLPPLEKVKELLKEKINNRKEATQVAKKETQGLIESLTGKAKELVTNGATEIQKRIKEFTEMSPAKRWAYGLAFGMGASVLGFFGSIAAWFGYDAWKNKAEYLRKLQTAVKDPKAALEKYGKEASEKVLGNNAQAESPEKGSNDLIEKLGFGGLGVGLLAMIRPFLGNKLGNKLSGSTNILKSAYKFRSLKLLGVGGVALFAMSQVYAHYESHPEALTKLGTCPSDPSQKKEWYEKLLAGAGVASHEVVNFATKTWKVMDGEATKEKYEKEGPDEGHEFLQDSELFREPQRMWKLLTTKIELALAKNPKELELALVALGITVGVGTTVGLAFKATEIVSMIIKKFCGSAKEHPMLWAIGLTGMASGCINGWEALKHIQVKKGMTAEDLNDMIFGLGELDIGEKIDEFAGSHPGNVGDIVRVLADNGAVLTAKISDIYNNFAEKCDNSLRNLLVVDANEKVSKSATEGLRVFRAEIHQRLLETEKKDDMPEYKTLFGEKFDGGIVGALVQKAERKEPLLESDIHDLMAATKGTRIRVFPAGGDKETAETIQWAILDASGEPSLPKNLCVNPYNSMEKQEAIAEEFFADPEEKWKKLSNTAYNKFRYDLVSELGKAITAESGETKSIAKRAMEAGWTIMYFGGNVVAEMGENMVTLGQGQHLWNSLMGREDLYGTEMLVDYAGSMVPVMIFSAVKNGLELGTVKKSKLLRKVICETIAYPLKTVELGKYIYSKAKVKDYAGILRDPAVILKDGISSFLKRAGGVLVDYGSLRIYRTLGAELAVKGKLEKWRSMIKKAETMIAIGKTDVQTHDIFHDMQDFFRDNHDLQEALGKPASAIHDISHSHIDTLAHESESAFRNFDARIQGTRLKVDDARVTDMKKGTQGHNGQTREQLAEETHKEAVEEIEKLEKKKIEVEQKLKEVEKALKKDPTNTLLQQELATATKNAEDLRSAYAETHQTLREIREAMSNIIHESHASGHSSIPRELPSVRAKKLGKGAGMLLGILGAGYLINKAAKAIHGESHEEEYISKDDEEVDFYGYEGEKKYEFGSTYDGEKYESPEAFQRQIERIEDQYSDELKQLLDPEWIKNSNEESAKNLIGKIADSHMQKVADIQSLIGANRGMMESFWNRKFTDEETGEEVMPKDIREQGVTAFMFIHKKHGALTLDYMNHAEIERTLFLLYDANHKGLIKGSMEGMIGETATTAGEYALRLTPYVGAFMSGVDAYEDFSRGNIRDGLWNTAWCIGGAALDIFTVGGGAALRAAKFGALAANTAIHTGALLGAQAVQEISNLPRSGSVKISELENNNILP